MTQGTKPGKRKIKSRSVTDVFDTEGQVLEERRPDEQQDADDLSMEEAARDFADGERVVKLYRTSQTFGGRPQLLGGVPREDFTELNIMEQFGGGRYFGRWKKKDGSYIRYTFDVAGPPKDPFKNEVKPVDPTMPLGFLKSNQPDEEDERPIAQAGLSAIDLLKVMAEVRRESREEMLMILDRLKPGPPPPDTTAQVFSLVEKIVPLIQGSDGGGNPVLSALMTFKEPIAQLVDGIHSALTKGPVRSAEPGKPAPAGKRLEPRPPQEPVKPSPEPEPEKNEETMLIESFRAYLPMMVHAASIGGEAELYRDLILEQIPPFAYDRLRTWLLKPGCLDDLAKMDGSIYAQQAWWESLRSLLVEALNEELGGHGVRSIQPEPNTDPSASGPAPSDPAA